MAGGGADVLHIHYWVHLHHDAIRNSVELLQLVRLIALQRIAEILHLSRHDDSGSEPRCYRMRCASAMQPRRPIARKIWAKTAASEASELSTFQAALQPFFRPPPKQGRPRGGLTGSESRRGAARRQQHPQSRLCSINLTAGSQQLADCATSLSDVSSDPKLIPSSDSLKGAGSS